MTRILSPFKPDKKAHKKLAILPLVSETLNGVLVIDKPAGWTSHDVVNKVRRMLGGAKTGHLGTLDPMATGVLPLVVGRATRLAQFYGAARKTYRAQVTFGYSTDSYDAEGERVGESTSPDFSAADLENALEKFRGSIEQIPPPVSAKKIGGKRAYALVREGKQVELKPVAITIHHLELLSWIPFVAELLVETSAGGYIRSLAHDLGQLLPSSEQRPCGATLTALRRTRSGDFTIEQAHSLEAIQEAGVENRLQGLILPMRTILTELPAIRVDEQTAGFVRQGRDFRSLSPFSSEATLVRAIDPSGELIAIGKAVLPGLWHPEVVL